MTAPENRDAPGDEAPRRKQLRIRQELIDEAQAILGTRTASETIQRALDLIIDPQKGLDAFEERYGTAVSKRAPRKN